MHDLSAERLIFPTDMAQARPKGVDLAINDPKGDPKGWPKQSQASPQQHANTGERPPLIIPADGSLLVFFGTAILIEASRRYSKPSIGS